MNQWRIGWEDRRDGCVTSMYFEGSREEAREEARKIGRSSRNQVVWFRRSLPGGKIGELELVKW
jgi:hypothetical protein